MSDQRCAIFVDAGFLLEAGGTLVSGTSLRPATSVDFAPLITAITDLATTDCELEPLRVYWYDASPEAALTEQHKQIALLPDVKVRLGRIGVSGGQKGVDLRLGLDLVGVARTGAARTAYVLTGDDDLAEAIDAAQDLGMRVKLIGIEDRTHRLGVTAVAEHLALQVDGILTLPASLITNTFHQSRTAGAPTPATVGPGSIGPSAVGPSAVATGSRPDPSILAKLAQSSPQSPGAPLDPPAVPHRVEITPDLLAAAEEVGKIVAEKVFETTTEASLEEIKSDQPVLPRHIDVVLLKDCASRMGETSTNLQSVRRTLRSAFWSRLNEMH